MCSSTRTTKSSINREIGNSLPPYIPRNKSEMLFEGCISVDGKYVSSRADLSATSRLKVALVIFSSIAALGIYPAGLQKPTRWVLTDDERYNCSGTQTASLSLHGFITVLLSI